MDLATEAATVDFHQKGDKEVEFDFVAGVYRALHYYAVHSDDAKSLRRSHEYKVVSLAESE